MGSFVNKTQRAGSMLRAQGFVELSNDCWDAADYISRLEAVVRAADELRIASHEVHVTLAGTKAMRDAVAVRTRAESAYHVARSRVTLPPLTQTNQAKDGDKEATNGKA